MRILALALTILFTSITAQAEQASISAEALANLQGKTILLAGATGKNGEERVDVVTILLWEADTEAEGDSEA